MGFPAEAAEPPQQLKGFGRVDLKPGESKVVTMTVNKDSLAAWDESAHNWKVYPGKYAVSGGASLRDIRYTEWDRSLLARSEGNLISCLY